MMLHMKPWNRRLEARQLLAVGVLLILGWIALTRVSGAVVPDFLPGLLLGAGIAVALVGITICATAAKQVRL